jgi:hypothetical protein
MMGANLGHPSFRQKVSGNNGCPVSRSVILTGMVEGVIRQRKPLSRRLMVLFRRVMAITIPTRIASSETLVR